MTMNSQSKLLRLDIEGRSIANSANCINLTQNKRRTSSASVGARAGYANRWGCRKSLKAEINDLIYGKGQIATENIALTGQRDFFYRLVMLRVFFPSKSHGAIL
jgi:hypothetical protein